MTTNKRPIHLPDLRYDCLQCGKGCEIRWTIVVTPETAEGIRQGGPGQRLIREGYTPIESLEDGLQVIGRRQDGSCLFLQEDRLCAIHAEQGFGAKPRPCRQFPFHPINTPEGYVIGMSFLCSAVQRDSGRPLEEHRADIEVAVEELGLEHPPSELRELAIPLGPGLAVSWPLYRGVESRVLEFLGGQPLKQALWQAAASLGLAFLTHLNSETPFELESFQAVEPGPRPDQVIRGLAGALISVVEVPAGGLARRAVAEAWSEGRPFYSPRLSAQLEPGDGPLPDWFDAQARRYFEHVVFRKFLGHGSTLGRLFALSCLYEVLGFYTRAYADGEIQVEHYYQALDTVEAELMLHADGLDAVYDHFQFSLLEVIDP
ncbi:MAG: YkgJ family cysteine cluster protein [Candidatus Eremiobacteraeota bacterium]|nr:YkgJ family cysteine cluster protein [Candidatus Eremiobacteraeota bacterium]